MAGLPPATLALLAANIAAFLLQGTAGTAMLMNFALWPPGPPGAPPFELWQLVTYGFLHGGFLHLAFNMLGLYMFGPDIERLFGSRFFAAYWFASVVAAALAHLLFATGGSGPPVPTVGASGGVFGLLLAFGWYFPHRKVLLLIPPIPLPARVFVALYGAVELYLGVTSSMSGVAHFAHLGGMVGGWLMIEFRRRARLRR